MKRLVGVSLLILSSLLNPIAFADAPSKFVDPNMPAPINVGQCASADQLDCTAGVFLIHQDGSVDTGTPVEIPCKNPPAPQGEVGVARLQCQPPFNSTVWNFTLNSHTVVSLPLGVTFQTPTWHPTPATTFGGLYINSNVPKAIFDTDVVEIQMRTSWLVPADIQVQGFNTRITSDPIPGGHLLTLWTSPMNIAIANGNGLFDKHTNQMTLAADVDNYLLSYRITDSTATPYKSETCFDGTNYTVEEGNIQSQNAPIGDRAGDVIIPILGPRFLPDKSTLNLGYYAAEVPVGAHACNFINSNLMNASQFSVSVTNDSGQQEVTTNSVKLDSNGIAHFTVAGITFPNPQIVLRGNGSANNFRLFTSIPAPTPSAPSRAYITCLKGKTTTNIYGVNPRCPSGFKPRTN